MAGPRPPGSVLFCCDRNAIRSPLAEGLAKTMLGGRCFVQSAGLAADEQVDGFAVAVAAEIGVDIARHRPRSLDEIAEAGGDVGGYELAVALSPAAQRRLLEIAETNALEVEYWPTLDPHGLGESRDRALAAYRECRDQLIARIEARFLRRR